MRKNELAVAMIQTMILKNCMRVGQKELDIVEYAYNIPDEMFPRELDVSECVLAVWKWKMLGEHCPEWIEQSSHPQGYRLHLDNTHHVDKWWFKAFGNISTCPSTCRALFTEPPIESIVVPKRDVDDFCSWAAQFDGWDEAIRHFQVEPC